MIGSTLPIATVVREFSPHGGLELYAHKIVEALLERGLKMTVICESNKSELQHQNLKVITWGEQAKGPKWQRLEVQHKQASQAVLQHGPFELVHSQHCPVSGADVVTFHNHTVERLDHVGIWWESGLNRLKRQTVPAYKLRYQQDDELCHNASCLIFPAEVMRKDYWEVYPFLAQENRPYVLAHPGASLNQNNNVTKVSSEQFSFLFVGRGYRKKGLDVLLQACARLVRDGRQFKLRIAGMSGKPLDEVRMKLLNLSQTVEYLGFQKDMNSVYATADAIILPSRVEPFGMAPIQAMQHGIVPIVSRVCGVAEVLSHQQDALLLQDHLSAAELAAHMARLMDDDGLRMKLSNAAKLSTGRLSWQQTVDRTLEAYGVALASKAKASGIQQK